MAKNHLETIAKGAGIFLIGMIVAKFFSYLFRILVARGLGPEAYGMLSLAIVIYSIGATIALFGLPTAIERYASFYRKKKETSKLKGVVISSLQITLPTSVFLAATVYLLSEKIAMIFQSPPLAPIILIFGMVIPFYSLLYIFGAVSKAFENIKYPVYTQNVLVQLLVLVFSAVAIYLGKGLKGVAMGYLFAYIISAIGMFLLVEFRIFSILKTKIKPILLKKKIFIYSLPVVLSALLAFIIGWTDTLMLGYFKSEEIVGFYNAALPTAGLLLLGSSAAISLLLPVFSSLLAKNKQKEISHTYKTIIKWIFFVNFPILLIMIFFPTQVLRILFGEIYTVAFLPLAILSFGFFMNSMMQPAMRIIDLFEKTKYHLLNNSIVVVLNIFLNYLLIPKYGMTGAAIASATSFFILAILNFTQVRIIQKTWAFPKDILKSGAVAFIIAVLIYFVSKQVFGIVETPVMIFLCTLYLGSYAFIIYTFGIIGVREKKAIISLLTRVGLKLRI